MNVNEQELNPLVKAGKFPIYIYWDAAEKQFRYSVNKKPDAVGSYWCDPFKVFAGSGKKKAAAVKLSDEEIAEKFNLQLSEVKRIKQVIMDKVYAKEEEIIPEAHLVDDLEMDSLDFIETVMTFEKEFAISIPDEQAEKAMTVAETYQLIAKKLAEKQQ